jgi:hypothetical protein
MPPLFHARVAPPGKGLVDTPVIRAFTGGRLGSGMRCSRLLLLSFPKRRAGGKRG